VGSWQAGPSELPLPTAALDLWRVDLSAAGDELLTSLTTRERERAAGILSPQERVHWARSRGALRALLGRYLQAEPDSLELSLGAQGKPRLAGAEGSRGLHFNLSHSDGLALYAFTACGPVGVDVQRMREQSRGTGTDRVALAARIFGARAAARLQTLPCEAREREFLRLWTRHEAALKQHGLGLGSGSRVAPAEAPWLVELDVGERAYAAVACARAPAQLRLWDWIA